MFPSCCVVSRICETELPYINSFITHYVNIGFDAIYFVNHKINQYQRIVEFLSRHPYADRCTVIPTNVGKRFRTNRLQNFAVSHINNKFDYVLGVDCDEYLQFDTKYNDVKHYISKHTSYRAHHFMWCYMVSDTDGTINCCMPDSWQGGRVKSMIKMTDGTLLSIPIHAAKPLHKYVRGNNNVYGGIHPNMGKYKRAFFNNDARLYHYWGRSFNDFVLKSTEQVNLAIGSKCIGGITGLKNYISCNTLPARFVGLAHFNLFNINQHLLPGKDYMVIDRQIENQLINERIDEESYNSIKHMYQTYKDYILEVKPGFNHPYNIRGRKFSGVDLNSLEHLYN